MCVSTYLHIFTVWKKTDHVKMRQTSCFNATIKTQNSIKFKTTCLGDMNASQKETEKKTRIKTYGSQSLRMPHCQNYWKKAQKKRSAVKAHRSKTKISIFLQQPSTHFQIISRFPPNFICFQKRHPFAIHQGETMALCCSSWARSHSSTRPEIDEEISVHDYMLRIAYSWRLHWWCHGYH